MSGNQANKINVLGEAPISQLLIKFSLPVIVALLVNALYSIIDRIFIGNSAGSLGIAGITVVAPAIMVIGACGTLVGMGAGSLISIRLGEKKPQEAELILGNALLLMILISILVTVLGLIFINPLLVALGSNSDVMPYAKVYMSILLYGSIFQVLSLGMNYFLRVDGSPKKSLATMLIGSVMNVILAPILIYGFHMGMAGAGLATVLSQFASAAWVMYYFFNGKSFLKIRRKNLQPAVAIMWRTLVVGVPSSIMVVSLSLSNMVMNVKLAELNGEIAVSAMGAIFSLFQLAVLPIFGVSQGIQPIIGFNFGAKKFDRVKQSLNLGLLVATAIAALCFVIMFAIPGPLMTLFVGKNEEFVRFGVHIIRISMSLVPLIGVPIVLASYFQATGKPKQAMLLTIARNILFLIPALLILPNFFQLNGVLFSSPLADLLTFVVAGLFLIGELKSINKRIDQQPLTSSLMDDAEIGLQEPNR